MSHGCLDMRAEPANWLFNWASAGTLVNYHD